MNVSPFLGLPVRSLLRNKVRTFLTMLGIIIGIASVIAMVAIGQGASMMVQDQIRSLGSNMIMVYPGSQSTGGISMGGGSRMTLTPEDAKAIEEEVPGVKAVSPVVQARGQIMYGDRNWLPASIRGEGDEYLEVKDWEMANGAFFAAQDVQAARKVCVIGMTIQENLFPDEDPVGKVLRIQNMPFRILGVLDRKGNSAGGEDQDDVVIAPWTSVKKLLRGSRFNNVDLLLVSSTNEATMPEVEREVTDLLKERHHIPQDSEGDFRILSMVDMVRTASQSAEVMTTLLAVIASISLLVGGVGIMNIMLVSVVERTREIGLRMAVGARRKDILTQFLYEGTLLSVVAGLIGILLGAMATSVIAWTLHWPTHVSPGAVALSFLCSCAVGIFFGFYPSLRASRLDPIAALRSD